MIETSQYYEPTPPRRPPAANGSVANSNSIPPQDLHRSGQPLSLRGDVDDVLARISECCQADIIQAVSQSVFGELVITATFQNGKLNLIGSTLKKLFKFK